MKVIIAGSRTITQYGILLRAMANATTLWKNDIILEIVSGGARGVDKLAEKFADHSPIIEKKVMEANWFDLSHSDAIIKINKFGQKYDAKAGFRRNLKMANYVGKEGALIAIWDGVSKGTKMMIDIAKKKGLKVFVYKVIK